MRNSSISAGRRWSNLAAPFSQNTSKLQAVGVSGGDAGHLEAAGAAFEVCGEGRVVVVVDRLEDVADRGVVVAHDGAERQRALVDDGAEPSAADGLDVAAEELGDVRQVAADVGQRTGAGAALEAPAHRGPTG